MFPQQHEQNGNTLSTLVRVYYSCFLYKNFLIGLLVLVTFNFLYNSYNNVPMRKIYLLLLVAAIASGVFLLSKKQSHEAIAESETEHEGYDGPMERGAFELLRTKDPALNMVPQERLYNAILETDALKQQSATMRTNNLVWQERGPIFDSVGPSNGNGRGTPSSQPQQPGSYTSGRIRALLIDDADATGNTVWTGGVAGGLWKTTNFLDPIPAWVPINDQFDNLAITYLAQDPSNSNVMYFCTGEATSNADAVYGRGVWKTTDHGATWVQLPATSSFNRNFKILVDINSNVFLATRAFGLRRSSDGGNTWQDITPSGLTATNGTYCTDIEFATTGRLIASFGYSTSTSTLGTTNVRYTDEPGSVLAAGWATPLGLPTAANRIELAARGDTAYAAPTNLSNNIVALYRSYDRGANWTKSNPVDFPSTINILNTQGWYNLALEINPLNGLELMVGGLDAYRSIDGGTTVVRNTSWVTTPPYVHADHHTYKWVFMGAEPRLIMCTDGGLFLSRNNGVTYQDRNQNLAIKQFYSGAIHPEKTDYFLAGAQDNGSHQLKNPGKTYSVEVTGGDGAIVDIDQRNPNFQFTSYVYNQYRRSTNDGNTWSSFNLSTNRGFFINPYEYDDSLKIMYASFAIQATPNRSILRWNNPTTATSTTNSSRDTLVINALNKNSSSSNASAFLRSPYTPNRLYVGGSNGSLVRIDDANTVTNATIDSKTTQLHPFTFPNGYINCITMGSSEDFIVAVFSNYGVNNVWYSSNAGASWSAIDGNLPDMPVRWALFDPENDNKLIIATETGVWTTEFVNDVNTLWTPSAGFPNVRTDMLKLRKSDNLILAATHGRGLWTTNLSVALPIKNITLSGKLQPDGTSLLNWKTVDETTATRYTVEYSSNGSIFTSLGVFAYTVKTTNHRLTSPVGYYRVKAEEPGHGGIYSNVITLRTGTAKPLMVKIFPNPVSQSGSFTVSSVEAGKINWYVVDSKGRIVQTGNANVVTSGMINLPIRASILAAGIYRLRVIQNKSEVIQSFIKQ
jgi:trimeric autotransporter adhesin